MRLEANPIELVFFVVPLFGIQSQESPGFQVIIMRLSSLSAAFFAAFAWTAKAAEEGEIKSVSVRNHTDGPDIVDGIC